MPDRFVNHNSCIWFQYMNLSMQQAFPYIVLQPFRFPMKQTALSSIFAICYICLSKNIILLHRTPIGTSFIRMLKLVFI